jgi:hypothetical protein
MGQNKASMTLAIYLYPTHSCISPVAISPTGVGMDAAKLINYLERHTLWKKKIKNIE